MRSLRRLGAWWMRVRGKTVRTRIYLKSGQILEVDATKFEWKYTGNEITSITWKTVTPENLLYINLESIAAISQLD